MNKPSERIVVFVTAAQKRAISATADELGISISELMRRAVIAFSATSDQVKAASIVDRLNAPRRPDALAQVLQKAAKPLRAGRAGTQRPFAAGEAAPNGVNGGANGAVPATHTDDALADSEAPAAARDVEGIPEEAPHAHIAPLPAAHTAEPDVSHAAREIAQAVVRLSAEAAAAAESEALDATATQSRDDEPLQSLSSAPFARSLRSATDSHDDAHSDDAAPEGGKFA
ncbi:hypothetical protein [Paraburkholderia lycopersici]|uniref:Ribbon-helix-helix protein, copG family n=1 Tax=Paraburkholderia lycopersici TaxID=416944 RepID=A0A1G6UPC7_9BURK|nr:hypothetical protein [Paraburkholderia lycopersici]SDD43094.1 hypothetical protein SAMN05421548_11972 [Paraburkholderia lycopersici]